MKKLTALLLALVMIFSLTACDGTDGGNGSGESAAWTEKTLRYNWRRQLAVALMLSDAHLLII